MTEGSRALDNPINWSFGVGRLFGIRIRLHVLFVLGAIWMFAQGLKDGPALLSGAGLGAGLVGLLFLIVLLHEFGHCFACRWVGGQAEEILLWPLGGLASVSPPHRAGATLVTVVGGPLVNVLICLAAAGVLIGATGSVGAVPWNPLRFGVTQVPLTERWQWWVVMVFCLSYYNLLFNLAPVFPFDGGRMVQCLLWPAKGYREATRLATGVGMIGAIGFGALALVTGQMLLLAIAGFGYITCLQQRQWLRMGVLGEEGEFGYDFSQGYTSLESASRPARRTGYFARRRAARAALRELREKEALAEHRRRVDEILTKISTRGADALTPEERRILETETQRQRGGRE